MKWICNLIGHNYFTIARTKLRVKEEECIKLKVEEKASEKCTYSKIQSGTVWCVCSRCDRGTTYNYTLQDWKLK